MKRDSERQPPRYDFSGGVRGKYAKRLGGPNAPWVAELARKDAQRWIAETLLRFQRVESRLVAYFGVVHAKPAKEAGHAAYDALENPNSSFLRTLWSDVSADHELSEDLRRDLMALLSDRNWLIHKSFFALDQSGAQSTRDPLGRVEAAVATAERAERSLQKLFLKKCQTLGFSETKAEEKAQEMIQQWAAA